MRKPTISASNLYFKWIFTVTRQHFFLLRIFSSTQTTLFFIPFYWNSRRHSFYNIRIGSRQKPLHQIQTQLTEFSIFAIFRSRCSPYSDPSPPPHPFRRPHPPDDVRIVRFQSNLLWLGFFFVRFVINFNYVSIRLRRVVKTQDFHAKRRSWVPIFKILRSGLATKNINEINMVDRY